MLRWGVLNKYLTNLFDATFNLTKKILRKGRCCAKETKYLQIEHSSSVSSARLYKYGKNCF